MSTTADLRPSLRVLGRSSALRSDSPRRRLIYPVAGFFLAQGAPIGLLLLRSAISGHIGGPIWVWTQITSDLATYLYLSISTSLALVVLGAALGRSMDRLRSTAITDSLTRLFNRRYFRSRLEQELQRAGRYGTPLSLLIIDVDRLKAINDENGHEAGDAAIESVAECIRENLRASDIAARYGGDEFAILLPHTSSTEALTLAERMQESLADRSEHTMGFTLSVSIGVAELDRPWHATSHDLIVRADAALYEAKSRGRNRVVVAPADRKNRALFPHPEKEWARAHEAGIAQGTLHSLEGREERR